MGSTAATGLEDLRALVFTRNLQPWKDKHTRVWEGDEAGHVGVQVGMDVVDATLAHGVAPSDFRLWLGQKRLVQHIPIHAASPEHAARADEKLTARFGCGYDLLGILGFPLLRDLDDKDKYWCSELAALYFEDYTGVQLPGRKGRRGVRLLRWAAHAHHETYVSFKLSRAKG